MYSSMYVLVKVKGPGHAFMAFGNSNPQIAFNQSGADGSNSASGDGADFSRVTWDNAKTYFITGSDKYYGYVIQNELVMQAYKYVNDLFEASPARAKQDSNSHRNRSYNIVTQNCATLTGEVIRECGIYAAQGIIMPMDVFYAMGIADVTYGNVSQWGVVERKNSSLTFSGPWGNPAVL